MANNNMNKKIDARDSNYRKCCGKYFVRERGFIEFELGYFHEWGVDSEELDVGALNYTIGIVELVDGRIVIVIPENIKFIDIG